MISGTGLFFCCIKGGVCLYRGYFAHTCPYKLPQNCWLNFSGLKAGFARQAKTWQNAQQKQVIIVTFYSHNQSKRLVNCGILNK